MRDIEPILNHKVAPEEFEKAKLAYKEIDRILFEYTSHYIRLGELLIKFEKDRFYTLIKPVDTYESVVYTNIYKFTEQEYGFKKRKTANLIAVARLFGDGNGKVIERYRDYSFSQLVELIGIQKYAEAYKERFTPDIKVKDMQLLKKAVAKGTFDYLLSVAENINKINLYLEAEKAGKSEVIKQNIEFVEEEFAKKDRVGIDGEYQRAENVQISAPETDKTAIKKALRSRLAELEYVSVNTKSGKTVTVETLLDHVISIIYKK